MALIQTFPTPLIRVAADVVRKLALAALTVVAVAALAVATSGAAGWIDPSAVGEALPSWTLSSTAVVIGVSVAAIGVLGARKNVLESERAQFDIR